MSNFIDYIDKYGSLSFEKMPFGEVDGLIFSQLAYTDFAGIAGGFDNDLEITLEEASEDFFNLHSDDELENKISIVYKSAMLLKKCASVNRYKNIKLLRYANYINEKIDKQFSAVNFYLNDKTAVIAFRGTDTSIYGVKESAMLSYMFPVPAQIQALYYFQESASMSQRDIIVCGHSKGGNLATFAAVSCSNSLKKKIIGVYEYDAPGFPIEMINRYDYIQMKEKINSYIPERSIIGCMLYHNSSLKIVKSNTENLKQHRADSWQISNNHFVFVNETDEVSKFIDNYIKMLLKQIGEDNIEDVFETIFDFFENAGIKSYDDLKNFDASNLIRSITTIQDIDNDKKQLVEDTIKLAIKELSKLIYKEKVTSLFKRGDNLTQPH